PALRHFQGFQPRGYFSVLLAPALVLRVMRERKRPHDRRKRKPLPDQRDDNDAESDKENKVAVWKRRSGKRRQRNGERRSERDHAADTEKAQQESPLPRRRRVASRQRGNQPAR